MDETLVDQTSGLAHHKKAWDQQDLLKSALSAYVSVLGTKGGRWPSWYVESKRSEDGAIHEDLQNVNAHLERLGWMGKLTKDENWAITVFPTPERQFPRWNNVALFWGLSFLTLTLAGNQWMSSARPDDGWFHPSSLVDALLGYTLPAMLVLLSASFLQQKIAARYGVRSGHLMPVPDFTIAFYALGLFPSSWLFWPFGILLIPTMPRMDARPWPNRAALGFTALSVPLTMGVAGIVLFFLGMGMTPEYLVSSTMPILTASPAFLSLIAVEFISPDAMIRLAWAHPWVHAGGMLMLFAWISLLPIPTFPGGRLLIARMGLFDARSSGTQSLIFVTALLFAYLFGVFEGFSLWFLVFALLLPLLFFFGNDLRIPMILDETTGLSEDHHRKMGTFLLIAFLLLLPASQPVVHDNDWDDPMTYQFESTETAVLQEDGTWLSRTKVSITNPSSLQKPFAVHAVFENDDHDWAVSWDCDGEDTLSVNGQGCGENLLPGRTAFFWLNFTWDGVYLPTTANFSYIVSVNDEFSIERSSVKPSLEVVPTERWYDVSTGTSALRCISLTGTLLDTDRKSLEVEIESNAMEHVQTTLVQLEGETGMISNYSSVPSEVCLSGLDPLVFDPSMATIRLNNDTFQPLLPERRPLVAYLPEDGWNIHSNESQNWGALLQNGGLLVANAEHCPINPSIGLPQGMDLDGQWVWDLVVRPSARIPSIEADQNLTLTAPQGTNISLCSDPFSPYPAAEFTIYRGPELLVTWLNTTTRFWTTPWAIATNGTMLNQGMAELTFHNPTNESIPFRLAREGSLGDDWQHDWNGDALAGGTTIISLAPPNASLSTMWLTLESGTVVLHLANYE